MAKNSLKGEVLAGTDFVQCSAPTGGHLTEINADGEPVSEIFVPPGRHRARDFMSQIGRGHFLVPSPDVYCYAPPVREDRHTFGVLAYETAASQTFRVDRADREKRRNDRLERMLNAQERRLALQERALSRARGEPEPDDQADADEPEPIKNDKKAHKAEAQASSQE